MKGSLRASWRRLAPFLPSRGGWAVAGIGSASFAGALAESGVLVLLAVIADSLLRGQSTIEVLGFAFERRYAMAAAGGLVVARVGLVLIIASASARFAGAVMERAQDRLVQAYLATSYAVRAKRPPGDLGAVVVVQSRGVGDLALAFAAATTAAFGLVAFGGSALMVNPLATLGIAALGACVLLLMRPLRTRSRRSATELAEATRSAGQGISEAESLQREIQLYQLQEALSVRLGTPLVRSAERYAAVRFFGTAVPQLFQAALLAAAVLSLFFIANNVDETQVVAVGAVVLLLIRSMSAAQQFVSAAQRIIEMTASAESARELIDVLEPDALANGDVRPAALTPLHLDGVGYSYDGSRFALSDVTLELGRGEVVGVVGPSGAGKSTLVELLLRLRLPTSGHYFAGGVDIASIDPLEFARRVAFVPQYPVLVAGTVRDNIDLYRGLDDEKIHWALERAHLAGEIASLPNGLDTKLGPDDRSLSGGQRQRLTIARALAGDPEVIVLDEPTSALDTVSETAIRETLAELRSDRLVVVVAHRFTTLQSCSRIVVLKDGVVEVDADPAHAAQRSAFFEAMVTDSDAPKDEACPP